MDYIELSKPLALDAACVAVVLLTSVEFLS